MRTANVVLIPLRKLMMPAPDDPLATLHQRALDCLQTGVLVCEAVTDQSHTVVDFRFVYANRQAGQWLGVEADELPGHTLRELPLPGQPLFDQCRAVFQTKQPARFDLERQPNRNLNHGWFEVQVQPFDDDNILVLLHDISDRKAEAERYAENLQAVLNGSPTSIAFLKAVTDDSGVPIDFRLAVCNDRFARLSCQPTAELTGQSYQQLTSLLWQEDSFETLKQVFMTRTTRYEERPLPGTDRWLGLSISRQDEGVLIAALDITDLKQMQQRQEVLANQVRRSGETVEELARLQEQVRSRGALLRTSSHDLRGSLGIIQGAAGLLAYANSDEERGQMLDMLQRNVQEVTHMLTDLLDYARLEAGQEQRHLLPLDAAELLRQIGHHVKPLADQRGLSFDQQGPGALPIQGDAQHISRMAQNLVLNALKHPSSAHVTLRWDEQDAQTWYFSVTNDAPAPPPPAGRSAVGAPSGEGMGLQLVRHLCALLDGQLRIENGPASSTYHVTLPKQY